MNDLISRRALCEYALNQKDKSVTPNDIMRFPPAEQETCVYWERESNFCALQRPSAQPEYEEFTPEEAASEIASESGLPAWYWLADMIQLKQMGYAICRKK